MKSIKKLLSFILALAVVITSFAGINMFSVSAATADDIKTAAEAYVKANENAVTAEGLLAAVQAVDSSVTLDTANDFYIKHAVPGVKDVMADGSTNEYPLNIEGSDGAVAAVFGFGGERIGFTCAFAHEVETIEINEVAIVGQSSGFSYGGSANSGKNVTAYNGTADKIVFPAGYKGTMAVAAVNNVKVVIYNNGVPFFGGAFKGSPSLKAVQIDNGDTALQLASVTNVWSTVTKATGMFSACPELKYFKLPNNITNNGDHYWTNLFPNDFLKDCPKLENVVMPTTSVGSRFTSYGYQVFYGTAIRDVVLPSNPAAITIKENAFGGSKVENGTRNIHQYADDMTNIRAVALVMAEVNELLRTDATGEQIVAGAKSAITGAHNAADVAEMINITTEGEVNNDLYVGTSIRIAAGSDTFIYEKGENKALASLNTNITLDQVFNPATANYTAIVVDDITAVEVNAVAVDGAVVGTITGDTTLTVGKNVITIPVTTTEGVSVNYTITVIKYGSLPEAVNNAAENYVKANENAVTADGLLAAVQAVDSSITLDTANDFYIKHAVPGVKDVMANGNENKYPLNIEGSDGAVAAVFVIGGVRYGFTCAFAHEVETIEIDEVAVVGTSAGFTYDDSGNVTAYTGTADKIVLPEDYAGTFVEITDQTYVDNVKVLVYNNKQYIRAKAFYDWDGLIAVQFKAGNSAWLIGGNNSNRNETYGFAECDNLKYVKLPDIINTSWYGEVLHNYMFANSKKLENLSFPELYPEKDTKTCFRTYYGTAIRDYVLPQYYITGTGSGHTTFEGYSADSPSYEGGTRNVHWYNDNMTFVRATALAAAAVNEAGFDVTENDIKDIALNAITGSADSESFRNSLSVMLTESIVNTDFAAYGKIVLSNRTDNMPISIGGQKTLISLKTGYSFAEIFAPELLNYTVTVPELVKDISVDAVPAKGAVVNSITGNTNLKTGDNTVTVNVTSTDGKEFVYTIRVIRLDEYDNLLKGSNFADDITLNNNTVFATGEFLNLLKADTNYEITYSYTGNITSKLKGFELESTSVSEKDEKTYVRAVFKTPVDLAVISETQLSFTGQGTVTDIVVKEVALKLNMIDGATIRFAVPKGMRFSTKTEGKEYYGENVSVSFGTLICPTDYLDTIEFTEESLKNVGKSYLDIKQSVWDKNDATVYNTVISNIKKENYGRAFSAISYADIAYSDGTKIRIYSDYEAADNSRSVYYVAQQELLDTETSYTEYEKFVLENYKSVAEENPIMYVSLGSDNLGPKVQVVTKYNSSYDMVMVLKSAGGNNIFNISTPLKIANTSDKISNDLASASYLINDLGGSDWFGPHKIYAVNNADGDNQGSGGYMGGSHNYNNNENPANATPTGRSANVRVVVDGVTYNSTFEGYANYVDIYWDTYVQAGNTIKADGSGREVLVEHHHMTYDGTTWLTDTEYEFLEEVKWVQHFGMQCVNGNNWNGEIKYEDGEWISISASDSNSNYKFTDTMTMRKNGHYLEMHLDNNYDLGDRRYLDSNNESGAYSRIYSGFGKSYFYLVNSNNTYMQQGETVSYRGYYRFYYSE